MFEKLIVIKKWLTRCRMILFCGFIFLIKEPDKIAHQQVL